MPSKIIKNKLLLVEGQDEIKFFTAFLAKYEIADIQILESKGKDQFRAELDLIMNEREFEDVISVGVIRDADESQQAAVDSICHHLRQVGLPVPNGHCQFKSDGVRNVGVFIAPGFTDKGMLESLILESLGDHPVKIASGEYLDNLKNLLAPVNQTCAFNYPRNIHKAHMHAFLAGMEKFIPSAGLAAQKGYYNLDSDVFNEVRDFLKGL